MSTHTLIRTGFIATLGVSALSVSAFTNAQNSSRYGNVGTYESGHCTQPCAAPVQQAPILVPQQAAPAVVYTQPAPVYGQQPVHAQQTAPIYSQPSQVLPGTCPVGTTAQPNGTCLQPSTVTGSYSAGPAFTTPSYAAPELSYSNSYAQAAPIDCPAGTTAQADGTCLQSGSASYGSATSSTSSTSTTYGSGTPQYSGQYSGTRVMQRPQHRQMATPIQIHIALQVIICLFVNKRI